MSAPVGLAIFLVAIVVIVIVANKLRINAGLMAFAFALLFGKLALGMNTRQIIPMFPTSMFFNIFIITMFFGYHAQVGSIQKIGQNLIYKFRKQGKVMPLLLYVTAWVIATLGAGADAGPIVISPLVFSVAMEMGFNPLLAVIVCNFACSAGACMPWGTSATIIASGCGSALNDEQLMTFSGQYGFVNLGISVVIVIFAYFVLKGWRHSKELTSVQKPEPLDKLQKTSLTVIGCFIALIMLPRIILLVAPGATAVAKFRDLFDFQTLAAIGIIVCEVLKIADGRKVLTEKVPWGVIITVCGMVTFINVFLETGFVAMVEGWLTAGTFPKALVYPVLILIGGFISMFTSFATVQPVVCSMVPAIAAATGLNVVALCLCVAWSGQCTSLSPFSQGGSMALIGCTDNELRQKLIPKQFMWTFVAWGITLVLAFLGFFNLFG